MKKLVIVALILSVITGVVVFQYLTNLEKQYETPKRQVVVAAEQIPEHTVVTAEMVEVIEFPQEAVHPLSSNNTESIVGKVTNTVIQPYEQILQTMLNSLEDAGSSLSYSIAEGYRAVTISTDSISGVAGSIKKGDRIDVISIMDVDVNGTSTTVAVMAAENIEVLQVGGAGDEAGSSSTSVTVSLPAEDVLEFTYVLSQSASRLVLRSIVDTEIINPPSYTLK